MNTLEGYIILLKPELCTIGDVTLIRQFETIRYEGLDRYEWGILVNPENRKKAKEIASVRKLIEEYEDQSYTAPFTSTAFTAITELLSSLNSSQDYDICYVKQCIDTNKNIQESFTDYESEYLGIDILSYMSGSVIANSAFKSIDFFNIFKMYLTKYGLIREELFVNQYIQNYIQSSVNDALEPLLEEEPISFYKLWKVCR